MSFLDIEQRWKEDDQSPAPKGVIECLKKVTPANGLLSFERFCAGLKICLLRNRAAAHAAAQEPASVAKNSSSSVQPTRPPSAPVLDLERDENLSAGFSRDNVTRGRKGQSKSGT
jgi:hypothetical protein